MKKVLVISYYFPPSGGAGVQRCLKFVKYLPQFGWQPIVLTARNADYPAYDESLLTELPPNLPVYRSKIIEPYQLYRALTGKNAGEALDIATLSKDAAQSRKLTERFSGFIRSNLFIPDARMLWRRYAVREGMKIIAREKPDVIFSTAPPYTCHLIARDLQRKSGLPWLCDFRDSWIGWVSAAKRTGIAARVELRLENSVLKNASRILTVNPGIQEHLLSRHSKLSDERWYSLPNGYDAADFQNLAPLPKSEKLILTYAGSLYGKRYPESLFQALLALAETDDRWVKYFEFRIVGRVGRSVLKKMEHPKLKAMIRHVPYVPHRENIRHLLASDMLLLIVDNAPANRFIVPGKVYEYLGAGKPILTLAPEGDTTRLIRDLRAGFIAGFDDTRAIRKILAAAMHDWQQGTLCQMDRDEAGILALDRKVLTEKLAAHLNELTGI